MKLWLHAEVVGCPRSRSLTRPAWHSDLGAAQELLLGNPMAVGRKGGL